MPEAIACGSKENQVSKAGFEVMAKARWGKKTGHPGVPPEVRDQEKVAAVAAGQPTPITLYSHSN